MRIPGIVRPFRNCSCLLVFIVAGFQQFILDPAIPLEEFQLILKLVN